MSLSAALAAGTGSWDCGAEATASRLRMQFMNVLPHILDALPAPAKARRFIFVLLKDFTMLSFACAVEPLRIANRMAGQELYSWALASEGGNSVACSNRRWFSPGASSAARRG